MLMTSEQWKKELEFNSKTFSGNSIIRDWEEEVADLKAEIARLGKVVSSVA